MEGPVRKDSASATPVLEGDDLRKHFYGSIATQTAHDPGLHLSGLEGDAELLGTSGGFDEAAAVSNAASAVHLAHTVVVESPSLPEKIEPE